MSAFHTDALGPGAELRITPAAGATTEALQFDDVAKLLDAHGALFFHAFNATASQFYALARRFVRKPLRTPLERFSHPLHRDMQTVTKGLIPMGFHSEFSHLPQQTEVMAFWCLVPGNATMVVDGVRLFAELSTETQQLLVNNRLRYSALHPPEMWRAFLGTDQRDDVEKLVSSVADYSCEWLPDGTLVTHYVRPAVRNAHGALPCVCNNMLPGSYAALMVTFEAGNPIPSSVIDEVAATARAQCSTLRWTPGDFLILDNTRHMHAREAQPPQRKMFLLQGWR